MAGAICVLNGCLHSSSGSYSMARSYQSYVLGDHQSNKSKNIYHSFSNVGKINDTTSPFSSIGGIQRLQHKFTAFSTKSLCSRNILSFRHNPRKFSASLVIYNRAYSSSNTRNKGDDNWNAIFEALSNSTDPIGNKWLATIERACIYVAVAVLIVGIKCKKLSNEVVHHIGQVFRKFHKYASLLVSFNQKSVVYEKIVWSALEDLVRFLLAISQLGGMIAPKTLQYSPQAWRGATIISFVWFFNRWKASFFSHAFASEVPNIHIDRNKLTTLDKVSYGLLILGSMAVAEAYGEAGQFIFTAGGVGGMVAFAARGILENLPSLLRPFTEENCVKDGTIEGQVVEMGLLTTTLITHERRRIIVRNSVLLRMGIVNISHAKCRASLAKIRMCIDDLAMIPILLDDIKAMLRSNPNVYLEKDAPYCYLSEVEDPFAELTVGCNLKNMKEDELNVAELDILVHAAKIIKKYGASLGSMEYGFASW